MRKCLRIICVLLFSINSLYCQNLDIKAKSGTAIVAYWNKDTIWIAADTKEVIELKGYSNKSAQIHKIKSDGKYVYAIAGKVAWGLKKHAYYDADVELRKAIALRLSPDNILRKFDTFILRRMDTALRAGLYSRQYQFDSLAKYPILGIILCSYNASGIPEIYYLFITIDGNASNWHLLPTIALIRSESYVVAGYDLEIYNKLDNDKNYFSNPGNIKCKLINLIKLSIDNHRDWVGLPIDILTMTRKGNRLCMSCTCN
jgi:hypothetical protein